jgi:ribosome-associated protein
MDSICKEGDTAPSPPLTSEAVAELALKILVDHKALEPVLIEVKEHCSFADYFIICSGASKRQVVALAEHLEEELGKVKTKPLGVEGLQDGLWVLLDYNTVIVHIFYQELRPFYDLEGLWVEAPRIAGGPSPLPPIPPVPEAVPNPEPESGSSHE